MHKVPVERPLNPVILEILRLMDALLADKGADYFLIGASARDILLYHVFGIPTARATHDVDFAIALENWDQFEHIKQLLLRACSRSPEQYRQEGQMNELQAGVEPALAVLP